MSQNSKTYLKFLKFKDLINTKLHIKGVSKKSKYKHSS